MIMDEDKTKKPPTLSSQKRDEASVKPKTQELSSNLMIRFVGILVVCALIGGAVFKWRGNPQNQNNELIKKELESLGRDLKALDDRLKVIEKLAPLGKDLDAFKIAVNAKFKVLEESLKPKAESKTEPTAKADTKPEADLEKKQDLEKGLKKEGLKKIHQDLIAAMEQQKPFADIFKALESLNPSPEFTLLIEPLKSIAPAKIRTKEQLIHDFDKVQEVVLQLAPKQPNADPAQSIIERVKGNIKVSEGKSERVQLKDAFQVVDIHLSQNDFEGAMIALKPYENKVDIQGWVKRVQEKLAYDSMLEKIKNFKGPL